MLKQQTCGDEDQYIETMKISAEAFVKDGSADGDAQESGRFTGALRGAVCAIAIVNKGRPYDALTDNKVKPNTWTLTPIGLRTAKSSEDMSHTLRLDGRLALWSFDGVMIPNIRLHEASLFNAPAQSVKTWNSISCCVSSGNI